MALTLSLAASVVLYSALEQVFLKPYPYEGGERPVTLSNRATVWDSRRPAETGSTIGGKPKTSFDFVEPLSQDEVTLTGLGDASIFQSVSVRSAFSTVLGIRLERGRLFGVEEVEAGLRVVVISHRVWQIRLGGSENLQNRAITWDGESWLVLGVMPQAGAYRPIARAAGANPIDAIRTD